MSDVETRSTDGSDSEGSLCDFIVHDEGSDDSGGEEQGLLSDDGDEEPQSLVASLNFDVSAYGSNVDNGRRRSRRARRPVQRYQDPDYDRLMYDDVDVSMLDAEANSSVVRAIDSGDDDDDDSYQCDDESDCMSSGSDDDDDE